MNGCKTDCGKNAKLTLGRVLKIYPQNAQRGIPDNDCAPYACVAAIHHVTACTLGKRVAQVDAHAHPHDSCMKPNAPDANVECDVTLTSRRACCAGECIVFFFTS